jgi:NAD-reducing hydrogenase small subunit
MALLKLATVWLGGCSGCHMSFLDLDEWLFELARHVELVYSPIADIKEFPEGVDVALVEGAVANEDNLRLVRLVRARSRILVSFGDCAVTGNVTSLRNPLGGALEVLRPVYDERVPVDRAVVPALLDRVQTVHEVVPVDFYLPGCPPPAGRIRAVLQDLVAGKVPQLDQAQRRFG